VRHVIEKEWTMIALGLFLPVTNNGWIFSTTGPQCHSSHAMLKAITLSAEDLWPSLCFGKWSAELGR